MIRYNAAHRGAERDLFPVTEALGMPVIAYTALRWRALMQPTPSDPAARDGQPGQDSTVPEALQVQRRAVGPPGGNWAEDPERHPARWRLHFHPAMLRR